MIMTNSIGDYGTPIQYLDCISGNRIYVKREDLLPFSFGGNKARKAALFFEEIDGAGCDCVVTYGGVSSNHCRTVANMAAARGMECLIVSPREACAPTYNSRMTELLGAERITVPVSEVHDTIETLLQRLRAQGRRPFFIPGGGHGNTGTQAYVNCYGEIRRYESSCRVSFDYIFHASGTGTTQAGLVCGKLLHGGAGRIVGISIARKNPPGRQAVADSVRAYLSSEGSAVPDSVIEEAVVFDDAYVGGGYGADGPSDVIDETLIRYGLPLDPVYTGKAFRGMLAYLQENKLSGKHILFIHTGGTPLFFDYLNGKRDLKDEYHDPQRRNAQ